MLPFPSLHVMQLSCFDKSCWASLWYASLNLSFHCMKTFRANCQGEKWLIVSIRLTCLLNPVNIWSWFQYMLFTYTFPLCFYCFYCMSVSYVSLCVCVAKQSQCKNVWVCVYLALLIYSYLHFNLPLLLLFSDTLGTEGSLSERSTPKSFWLRMQSTLHSVI